jgi:small-conductance mechanosensitive channel
LALALTTLLLVLWDGPGVGGQDAEPQATPVRAGGTLLHEVSHTFGQLADNAFAYAPRVVLALAVLAAAALLSRLLRSVLRRALGQWERTDAVLAVGRIVLFAIAAVVALSILAGDARAVAGSVGLLGLAASWALQTPIESFTGWLLNAFRGYYRVGDRVAVGDVFGDVYSIDILTTTVWEAGGRGKPVGAAQPTGALITFPNSEVLRSNVVNYSRDFPHVWDELTIGVSNESDLAYASRIIENVARRVLGPEMTDAATEYGRLLEAHNLTFTVEDIPRVYLSGRDAWTDCTVRYMVPVRTRRHWSSTLLLEISAELAKPEHARRVQAAYPRTEVSLKSSWDLRPAPPSEPRADNQQ